MHGIMSARQPVYIMQPQPQRNDGSIFNGLGGFVLSVLAGLLLGQFGGGLGGLRRFPTEKWVKDGTKRNNRKTFAFPRAAWYIFRLYC